jgi:hypothetical protein
MTRAYATSLRRTFAMLEACQIPPRAVLIPRRFSSAAMAASVV